MLSCRDCDVTARQGKGLHSMDVMIAQALQTPYQSPMSIAQTSSGLTTRNDKTTDIISMPDTLLLPLSSAGLQVMMVVAFLVGLAINTRANDSSSLVAYTLSVKLYIVSPGKLLVKLLLDRPTMASSRCTGVWSRFRQLDPLLSNQKSTAYYSHRT